MQEIRTCIYCLQKKIFFSRKKDRRNSEFNREHVVHAALAPEMQNTATLIGRVCIQCNQYFGNTIDTELTRGGFEGFQRFDLGFKSTKELHEFREKELKFGAFVPRSNQFVETRTQLHDLNGKVGTKVEPFVLIHSRQRGQKIVINQQDLSKIQQLIQQEDLDLSKMTFCTNGSKHEEQRLINILEFHGITVIGSTSENTPSRVLVHSYTPSSETIRGIAKIAFNYLAFLCEKKDPELVLSPEFDEIRKYIRYGINPANRPVEMIPGGQINGFSNGHSAYIKHVNEENQSLVVVTVSLFNGFTYGVALSREKTAKSPDNQAHHWDLFKKRFYRIPTNILWAKSDLYLNA